jgi:hypothetical protein
LWVVAKTSTLPPVTTPSTKEILTMRSALIVAAAAALGAGQVSGLLAAELKAGDAAPGFELPGSDGKTHRLSDLKGKTVVLAWFPKAFTGG